VAYALTLLWQASVIAHQKRIGRTNDPVGLQRKLGLERDSIPKAIGNEMVEAVAMAWSKPFRHRLDTFPVTGTNERGHICRRFLCPSFSRNGCKNAESSVSHSVMSRPQWKRARIISNLPCPILPK
jgi:hypothetical protein